MAGKAGRYISIENGPTAVSKPRIRIRLKYFFVGLLMGAPRYL
jgi:hypothetical protein